MKLLSVGLPGREMPKAGRAKRSQLEDDAFLISSEVEVPRGELRALIDTDRIGIADALNRRGIGTPDRRPKGALTHF